MEALNRLVKDLEGGPTARSNSQPDAVQMIVAAAPAGASAEEWVEEDETENPFAFGRLAAARDHVGLPKNHPSYVKRSCNACYGRGYRVVSGGVKVTTETSGESTRTYLCGRRYEACFCVEKGHAKVLRDFDRAVKIRAKAIGGDPVKAEHEARRLEFEVFTMILGA